MTTYCRIENGVVVDRALFDGDMPGDWPGREDWVADETAQLGWSHDGETFSPPPPAPPSPTAADVVAERERRLALGFDHDFGDGRGVHRIGTTVQDMAGWREVTDLAGARVAAGDTTTAIHIVTDTGPASVTPPQWTAVLLAAAAARQPLWAASFILQAMDPIPADFADDSHWTA